jgi:hypothetical protein
MKTLNRILFISLVTCSSLLGQVFKFGIVSSAITYDNDRSEVRLPNEKGESSSRIGMILALGYDIEVLPFASVLVECNYEQDKSYWNLYLAGTGFPYFNSSQPLRFDYLSFSVLPKFRYEYSSVTVYSITGAQLKFELPVKYMYAAEFSRKQLVQTTVGGGLEFTFRSPSPLTVGTEIRIHPSSLLLFTQGTATVSQNPTFEYMIAIRRN